MNSFRRIFCTAALAFLIAGAGMTGNAAAQEAAQKTAKPVPLTEAQKAGLRRVEDHLNGLKTLRARFIQVSQRGAGGRGRSIPPAAPARSGLNTIRRCPS